MSDSIKLALLAIAVAASAAWHANVEAACTAAVISAISFIVRQLEDRP